MSTISLTSLYDMLASKLGKETARDLTTFIENKINSEMENKSKILATKEDLAKVKFDILKWLFAFWITIILMLIGQYLKG
jgi:hypothetical protein